MQFTQEHKELARTVARFVKEEIDPHADQWEAEGIFPARELFGKMAKLGLLGINMPTEYGGLGLDFSYSAVFAEEIGATRAPGVGMGIGVHTNMATPALARFGTDALRREFLAPSIAGELVSCLGVSEVGAGSDVASIRTVARKDGDDYVIDGGKMWTTNGTQADWMCLLAITGDGPPHKNKSLICVPMNAKGVSVARRLDKMGMRSSDTAQIFFDGVRVPRRYLIGEEGMGFTYQMLQFQEERMWGAASVLKSMDLIIEDTIAYTRDRIAFQKPILDNQVVHFRLAELKTEVEALRSLTYRAVETFVRGKDATQLASMAKLKAGRLLRELTDACLQFYGGMGFMNETLISRHYRDGRLMSIGGGADEVMLSIICKYMGTLPKIRFGTEAAS